MSLPSGENATEVIKWSCPMKGPETTSPVCASQIRILESPQPATMCFPLGENATELTTFFPRPPLKGPEITSTWPVSAPHTIILPSLEPDTIYLLSGENATERTMSVCLVKGPETWYVSASQTLTIQSHEPDTMYLPFGENATEVTLSIWPSKGLEITWNVPTEANRSVRSQGPDKAAAVTGAGWATSL